MIKEMLQPRPEVLSGRLHGVTDLERVLDSIKKALESRAKEFFDFTFVSGELRRLIEGLHHRLASDEAVAGLFLAEGPKGVGKSHALFVPLHLIIFFGANLESNRAFAASSLLNQSLSRYFGADEKMPADHPGLQIFPAERLAMLRIRARAQGNASRPAFTGTKASPSSKPWSPRLNSNHPNPL